MISDEEGCVLTQMHALVQLQVNLVNIWIVILMVTAAGVVMMMTMMEVTKLVKTAEHPVHHTLITKKTLPRAVSKNK